MVVAGIPIRMRQVAYIVGDLVALLLALQLGHLLGQAHAGAELHHLLWILDYNTGATLLFVGVHLAFLYVMDAYGADHDYRERRHVFHLGVAATMAFAVLMMLHFAFPFWGWGRRITLLVYVCFAGLLVGWRNAASRTRPRRRGSLRTLIVGAGDAGRAIIDVIRSNPEHRGAQPLVGLIDDTRAEPVDDLNVLGGADQLLDLVERYQVKRLIVAEPANMGDALISTLLRAKARGVQIVDMPTVYKNLTGKLPIQHIASTWIIFGPGFADRPTPLKAAQRLVDIAVSLGILAAVSPLMLAAMVAMKLTDPGPIFFTQERLGKNERPFRMFKLRTMVVDAEKATGAVWSQGAGDPRVTRVGRFLRRSRLDEVPQLWNVIRGDMAMVGPRPEREHFVRKLESQIPFYSLRFASKPGVTGWAQVMYRYGASVEDSAVKLQYELYSVQEMNPALYGLILFKTVQTVLVRPGS